MSLGLALFLSWYIPANHGFWFPLDSGVFHFFNQALVESRCSCGWLLSPTTAPLTAARCWQWAPDAALSGSKRHRGRRRIVIIGLVMLLFAVVLISWRNAYSG
jgi:hypothetical protein